MKTQLTFGIAFDVAGNTIVVAHNAAMTVPVESGYTVRIVPELVEIGVKETKAGIKFPGKGTVSAIIVVDTAFGEVQVRQLDSAWTRVSLAQIKDSKGEAQIDQLMSKIDKEGEIMKLIAAALDDELQVLTDALLTRFGELISEINTEKLAKELKLLLPDDQNAAVALSE